MCGGLQVFTVTTAPLPIFLSVVCVFHESYMVVLVAACERCSRNHQNFVIKTLIAAVMM